MLIFHFPMQDRSAVAESYLGEVIHVKLHIHLDGCVFDRAIWSGIDFLQTNSDWSGKCGMLVLHSEGAALHSRGLAVVVAGSGGDDE